MNRRKILTFLSWLTAVAVLIISCNSTPEITPSPSQAEPVSLTISAAASVSDALQAIAPLYQQVKPEVTLTFNFGASGSLQQQIEQGAPVDVFLSAAPKQMNQLEAKKLLVEGTRRNLLENDIVLIVPKEGTAIANFDDLKGDRIQRLAIGDPASVPAGDYAKDVLTSLNLYEPLTSKLVLAKDVRQVLSYVETGNVDAGMVYKTDAQLSDQVRVVTTAPANSHDPIVYPIAVITTSQHPDVATAFIDFLESEQAKTVFERYGFKTVNHP